MLIYLKCIFVKKQIWKALTSCIMHNLCLQNAQIKHFICRDSENDEDIRRPN